MLGLNAYAGFLQEKEYTETGRQSKLDIVPSSKCDHSNAVMHKPFILSVIFVQNLFFQASKYQDVPFTSGKY